MQMRIDHAVDARRIDAACRKSLGQFITRVKFDGECLGQRADAAAIVLQLAVKSSIENHPAPWAVRSSKLGIGSLVVRARWPECRRRPFEPSADHWPSLN